MLLLRFNGIAVLVQCFVVVVVVVIINVAVAVVVVIIHPSDNDVNKYDCL